MVTSNSDTLRIGGMGITVLDCISPMNKEFKAGQLLVQRAVAKIKEDQKNGDAPLILSPELQAMVDQQELVDQKADKISIGRQALTDYINHMRTCGHRKPGAKGTYSPDDNTEAAACYGRMQEAARQINLAADYLKEPQNELWIRFLGSTTANKMSAVKAWFGDDVEAHLLGILSAPDDHGNLQRMIDSIKNAGIVFHDFADAGVPGEKPMLERPALGYIYQGSGDRTAIAAPREELDTLLKDPAYEEYVKHFAETPPLDIYFVEAGDIGKKKFGNRLGGAFSHERALHSGKPIMLGLPTDKSLILHDPSNAKSNLEEVNKNRAKVFELINAENTVFIGSNEEEAVALFCNEALSDNKEKAEKQIESAWKEMQRILKEKKERFPDAPVEPIGFISNGVKGVHAVTAHCHQFVKGKSNPNIVNSIGSGDALFGGSAIWYMLHVTRPEHGKAPLKTFSDENLVDMCTLGQDVAYEVVGQKGAQIGRTKMKEIKERYYQRHGQDCPSTDVPVNGQFQRVDIQEPSVLRAK